MKNAFALRSITALVALFVATSSHAADIVSTFDTGPDGWTLDDNVASNLSWRGSGGNLGGYLLFTDNLNPGSDFIAPSKFLGNWRSLDERGSLRYDHRIIDVGGVPYSIGPYEVRISGPGGMARWNGITPPLQQTPWTTQTVPISEGAWTVQSGSWAGLLANVTNLTIRGEMVGNDNNPPELDGIDNVILTAPVPEPASLAALGLGAAALLRRRKR